MSALDTLLRVCDKTGVASSRKNELADWFEKMEMLRQRLERSAGQGTPDTPYFPTIKWGQAWGGTLPGEAIVLFRDATQSIPYDVSAGTAIKFDSSTYLMSAEEWGWAAGGSTVSVPCDGLYLVTFTIRFEQMALGSPVSWWVYASREGPGAQHYVTAASIGAAPAGYATHSSGAGVWLCKTYDTFVAKAYHKAASGTAKNIDNAHLSIVRVR